MHYSESLIPKGYLTRVAKIEKLINENLDFEKTSYKLGIMNVILTLKKCNAFFENK